MHRVVEITDDIFWVGAGNRRLSLFENIYPAPSGMEYNSYLIRGKETILVDTVDPSVQKQFFENIMHLLDGKNLDYVIVNHLEPDHAGSLAELVLRFPNIKIVTNKLASQMLARFNCFEIASRLKIVEDGEVWKAAGREFHFVRAPMVHWPEVMVTYEAVSKTLFSADAFGTFGALSGNIFADELNFERDYLDDSRRYYSNIVGKYGDQALSLIQKMASLDIKFLCPLHGPIWRGGIDWYVNKYKSWATYTPEETAVVIFYASIYGNTENAALVLASHLGNAGVRNIKMYDVSKTHFSYLVSEAFRASHLVFASPTYNAGIFFNMETLLHALVEHNLQNRKIAIIENGSWALTAAKLMHGMLSQMKDMTLIGDYVSIESSIKEADEKNLAALSRSILETLPHPQQNAAQTSKTASPSGNASPAPGVDNAAFFKFTYGLYLLTAKDGAHDNGCIINTALQVTDVPKRISIAVNKQNYTCDIIAKTGLFNVSVLTEDTSFKTIQNFGFQSGRHADKFVALDNIERDVNGLVYAPSFSNASFACKVVSKEDVGTHMVFTAEVNEAVSLSARPSLTYKYYADNIKPKPDTGGHKKGWVCKVCGYIFEGDDLPADFICPLCKHGAADFEKLGA